MKKKKKQNGVKVVIIAVILVAMLVGYYFYLSNKTREVKEVKQLSEVDQVLLRNLKTDYPPSPKEVVKYYAEITKCFYDGKYTEDQLKELAVQSRALLDDELIAQQTDSDYLFDLQMDISEYQKNDIHISSYATSSSVDVEYSDTKDGHLASLYCIFNIRKGTMLMSSNHQFILRKDDDGHWKILGWTLAEDEEEENEEKK